MAVLFQAELADRFEGVGFAETVTGLAVEGEGGVVVGVGLVEFVAA